MLERVAITKRDRRLLKFAFERAAVRLKLKRRADNALLQGECYE